MKDTQNYKCKSNKVTFVNYIICTFVNLNYKQINNVNYG